MNKQSAAQTRSKSYKKQVIDGRRKRNETTVKVRKSKREEQLSKRRNLTINNFVDDAAGSELEATVDSLPALAAAVKQTANADMHFQATHMIRKLLSKQVDPPVEEVLAVNVIGELIQFLGRAENPKLQFEAAWALTNIASTEHTSVVVEAGILPPLVPLLISGDGDVREQAIWCIGNIAGDSTAFRDLVLEAGALGPLLQNITQPFSMSLLRNATWCVSNLCRGKPQSKLETIQMAIPVLAQLAASEDAEVCTDACWALSYISDGADARIQAVVNSGVVSVIVKNLYHAQTTIVTPSLRTLGNIVSGNEAHTQAVVDAGGILALQHIVNHPKKVIRKEACWALSNITAGTRAQVAAVCQTPGMLGNLMQHMAEAEWEVRKEATWALCNVCSGGGPKESAAIMGVPGAVEAFMGMMEVQDAKMVVVALDAINGILKHGSSGKIRGGEAWVEEMEEAGVSEKLEELQEHPNEDVYNRVVELIETYFADEEEEENAAPNVSSSGAFTFEAPVVAPMGTFSFNFGQ